MIVTELLFLIGYQIQVDAIIKPKLLISVNLDTIHTPTQQDLQ